MNSLCPISNKFEEGSEEFEAIAARNKLDILLYKFVETLFEAQKDIVDSFQQASDDLAAEMASVEAELNDSLPQVDAEVAAEMALLPPGSAMPVDIPPKLRHSETPPWKSIDFFIQPVTVKPKPDETSVYWHIPKSGGTNAKSYFGCLGLALGMFECAPCCTESWLADNVITFVSITHGRTRHS